MLFVACFFVSTEGEKKEGNAEEGGCQMFFPLSGLSGVVSHDKVLHKKLSDFVGCSCKTWTFLLVRIFTQDSSFPFLFILLQFLKSCILTCKSPTTKAKVLWLRCHSISSILSQFTFV